MNSDSEDRLIKRVEQLHDKLDAHATETHDRWEGHEKEHRSHDKEHSILGQWQVETLGKLQQGSATMADLRARTKPLTAPVIASFVIAIIGFPVVAVLWVKDGLDAKADRTIAVIVEKKAERSEVDKLNEKLDALTTSMAHVIQQLQNPATVKPKREIAQ